MEETNEEWGSKRRLVYEKEPDRPFQSFAITRSANFKYFKNVVRRMLKLKNGGRVGRGGSQPDRGGINLENGGRDYCWGWKGIGNGQHDITLGIYENFQNNALSSRGVSRSNDRIKSLEQG